MAVFGVGGVPISPSARVGLVLGGGSGLFDDIRRVKRRCDYVFACNEAGTLWPGPLEAWVTLHPEKMEKWMDRRAYHGFLPPKKIVGIQKKGPVTLVTNHRFPNQRGANSSGQFAAKVALVDWQLENAILCGVPIDRCPHFFKDQDWPAAGSYRVSWLEADLGYLDRLRSMSGWSSILLGEPVPSDGPAVYAAEADEMERLANAL